jgi:hypothetical protein
MPRIDPIAEEFGLQVVRPWQALRAAPPPPNTPATAAENVGYPWYPSLYLILDLGAFLQRRLPQVWSAITDAAVVTGAQEALRASLAQVSVPRSGASAIPLTTALADLADYLPLAAGARPADLGLPGGYVEPERHNLATATLPGGATWLDDVASATGVSGLVRAALIEAGPALTVPPELSGLIKDDPVETVPGEGQTAYVIRTVFIHAPCRPVLSAPSHPIVLARATDGDAPARKIRIPLPDVSNLRGFQRGVGLEMPPSVTKLVNRVNPKMLEGDPLGPDVGVQLGWICSFSIQIIFLCAFIVLFIFLLLLNIVFWWMPLLRICFPVPVRRPAPSGPRP